MLTSRARRKTSELLSRSVVTLTSPSVTAVWIHAVMRLRALGGFTRRTTPGSRRILVIRLDAIGDVVMTGPFLAALRRAFPLAHITLVVAPSVHNVVEECPYVDRVLVHDLPWATRWWHPLSRRLRGLGFARRYLWPEHYDVAVVPRWGEDHYEATILAYLSGAPVRVGYGGPTFHGRPLGYERFLTRVVHDQSVKHEVERNICLLPVLGVPMPVLQSGLEVWLSDRDQAFADHIMANANGGPLVALGPGAGSPKRMWAIDRFEEVGRWLTGSGAQLVLVGGANDVDRARHLRQRLGDKVIDLTDRTTVRETAAVLRRCILFCGNDSGPMHLAAAVKVPVVEISCHPQGGDDLHPNSPKRFGPWGVPNRVVQPATARDGCDIGCRIEAPHCILNVEPDAVVHAIESLREETNAQWMSG